MTEMRGNAKGKGKPDADPDRALNTQARHQSARLPSPPPPIDETTLREYLVDALPPETSARVEKALRESAELRARLEDVRQNRADGQLHSLGAIWHRSRLTCPSRQQLGSFLLDALDPALASYLTFHLEVIECPFCQANLADLKVQSQTSSAAHASRTRQRRILQSSQHLLGDDTRG
jgi:hypothetical protein